MARNRRICGVEGEAMKTKLGMLVGGGATLALLLSGCGSESGEGSGEQSSTDAAALSTVKWSTDCDAAVRTDNPCSIRDESGREVILRGVNARVQGVFDVDFDDGRESLEPIPVFDSSDTAALNQLGFNFLRLPINWSGIAPEPEQYSQEYVDNIKQVVDLAEEAGIQVLLDMHQDAYSKEIGEDGAPLWAIVPPPEQVNEGGELNLLPLRLAPQTQRAFASFWKNEEVEGKGLQDHYIEAMNFVMEQFKDSPAVVGMEIFNEPWLLHAQSLLALQGEDPGLDVNMIYDFYTNAVASLQETAPDKLVVFEPDVAKNDPPQIPPGSSDQLPYSATVPDPIPWNTENTVYGPHFYINSFFNPGDEAAGFPNITPDDPDIALNMTNTLNEAAGFQAPLLIGEFGFTDKAAQFTETLTRMYSLADQYAFSTAQWVWKEDSQDSWGFFDFEGDTPVLRENVAEAASRAYPRAISGTIATSTFDADTAEFSVEFSYADTGAPHEIFLPVEGAFATGFTLQCNGEEVEPQSSESGVVTVECGDAPGEKYTLTASAD
jgi:endoglycosylceramidase